MEHYKKQTSGAVEHLGSSFVKRIKDGFFSDDEQFRAIMDTSPIMLWITGADKRCLYLNKGWLDFTGRQLNEVLGRGWMEDMHPDDLERCKQISVPAFDERKPYEVEYRLKHHSGNYRWILEQGAPLLSSDNEFQGFVGGCTDIHNQKMLEQALRESEARYKSLFDRDPVAIYSCDLQGVIKEYNQRAVELWGREPAQGETDKNLYTLSKPRRREDGPIVYAPTPMEEILSGEIAEVNNAEAIIERPDGSRINAVMNIRPLKNEQGEITGAFNCFYDVTERKNLEERKDEFIGVASHELRTPITVIKGFTEILQKNIMENTTEENAEILKHIEVQSDRLMSLVHDLLSLSQIQDKRLALDTKPTDLDALVAHVVRTIQYSTPQHKIIIEGKIGQSVMADQRRIEQVLTNFLTNAFKHSPDHERVFVRLEKEKDRVVIKVEDFGEGIPERLQERIFERFYRADEAVLLGKKSEGFGLGLYIAGEIIKRHGGTIGVRSKLGEGSTFYFTLPL